METIQYKPKGVCTREISITLDKDVVVSVVFRGGCDGNSSGISRLVAGMTKQEVIQKLKGIDCDGRGTSCPDQLTLALEQTMEQKQGIA